MSDFYEITPRMSEVSMVRLAIVGLNEGKGKEHFRNAKENKFDQR